MPNERRPLAAISPNRKFVWKLEFIPDQLTQPRKIAVSDLTAAEFAEYTAQMAELTATQSASAHPGAAKTPAAEPTQPNDTPAVPAAGTRRGTKRRAPSPNPSIDPRHILAEHASNFSLPPYPTENPPQIRAKIRRVVDSNEMTVREFCAAVGVGAVAYKNFMEPKKFQGGWDRCEQSKCYKNASRYFAVRAALGLKLPTSKRRRTDGSGGVSEPAAEPEVDVSEIVLEGEEEGEVPIFDTCDVVRKKIGAFLPTSPYSAASFCRAVTAQLKGGSALKIQPAQLSAFRSQTGARDGCNTNAFYACYVFFEKLRIQRGVAKSADRGEMERLYKPLGGFPRWHKGQKHGEVGPEDRIDSLGRVWKKDYDWTSGTEEWKVMEDWRIREAKRKDALKRNDFDAFIEAAFR